MKALIFALLAFFTVARSFAASADDTDAMLATLEKTVSKEPISADGNKLRQYLAAARLSIARGDYAEAERELLALRPAVVRSDESNSNLVDRIVASLHAHRADREAALNSQIDAMIVEIRTKFGSHAPPSEYDSFLSRLSRLPSQPSRGYGEGDGSTAMRIEAVRTFVMRLQDYLVQSAQGSGDQATGALNEMLSITARVPIVPRSDLFGLQKENAQRQAASRDAVRGDIDLRFAAALKRLQQLIDAAHSAAELDRCMDELDQLRLLGNNRVSNDFTAFLGRIEQARRFVYRWQEYLAQTEAGDWMGAKDTLKNLVNDSSLEIIYPRSRVLERLYGAPHGAALAALPDANTLTPEKLEDFVRKYKDVTESSNSSPQTEFRTYFSGLLEAQRLVRANEPNAAALALASVNDGLKVKWAYSENYSRAYREILLQVLPMYLGLPSNLKPRDGESPGAFFQRTLDSANATHDWSLGQKMHAAAGQFAELPRVPSGLYEILLSATNFERARQYAEAVRVYRMALGFSVPGVPAKEIGEILESIKKTHPTEYGEGQKPLAP